MVKDIVCGMIVDEKSPPAKINYQEKDYFFCSEYCKTEFEKAPGKYILKGQEQDKV